MKLLFHLNNSHSLGPKQIAGCASCSVCVWTKKLIPEILIIWPHLSAT